MAVKKYEPGTQPNLFEENVHKTVTKVRGVTASAKKNMRQARSAVKRSRDLCLQAAKAIEISKRLLNSLKGRKGSDAGGGGFDPDHFFIDNMGEQMVKLAICLPTRKSGMWTVFDN